MDHSRGRKRLRSDQPLTGHDIVHPRGGKRLRFDQPLTAYPPARRQRHLSPTPSPPLPAISPVAPDSSGPAQRPAELSRFQATKQNTIKKMRLLPPYPAFLCPLTSFLEFS